MIEFKVIGKPPSKKNHYRIIKLGRHASLKKSDDMKRYEGNFYLQVPAVLKKKNYEGKFTLIMDVYYNTIAPDIDGAVTSALDCLQGSGVIKNDNRCFKLIVEKFIIKGKTPYIDIKILPYE